MKTNSKTVKIVVFVPESHADKVRAAMGKAGAGKIGNYGFCSFSVKGVGRFKPLKGAKPAVGKLGKLEGVKEERIEVVCPKNKLQKVVKVIRKAHPYEEVAIDVYPIVDIGN